LKTRGGGLIEVTYWLKTDVMEWVRAEERRRGIEAGLILSELVEAHPATVKRIQARLTRVLGRRASASEILNELVRKVVLK
jgi:hypothetical protein